MSETEKSFRRCLIKADFFDRFYEIFLKSHPSIAAKFKNTNMKKQKQMLRAGLMSMIMYAEGKLGAKAQLTKIAQSHSDKGAHNIPPSLYEHWIDSLIQALAETDPQWTPKLERSWRNDMKKGVTFLILNY